MAPSPPSGSISERARDVTSSRDPSPPRASRGTEHSFPPEGQSSHIPLQWTLGPADPSGLFSCSPRQGLLFFAPDHYLGPWPPVLLPAPPLTLQAARPRFVCTCWVRVNRSCALALGDHTAEEPHATAVDTPGPGWAGVSKLVCTPLFQMFQKEKQVLEELSRLTGTRLQPLTRGLF